MGRGPGAVTSVALPPARAWRRDASSSAVPEKRWCADANVEAPNGRGHLALCYGRIPAAAGPPCRAHSLRPAPGLQVHLGVAPFSALRRASGRALPAGGAVPARRARPSLRQWVWTRVGEEGEGRLCLLPLPPPSFFRLRTRGAIFLPRVTSLRCHAKPGG